MTTTLSHEYTSGQYVGIAAVSEDLQGCPACSHPAVCSVKFEGLHSAADGECLDWNDD